MCDCDCELPKRVKWDQIRSQHAKELAERIRAAGADQLGGAYDGYAGAADLIDPGTPKERK